MQFDIKKTPGDTGWFTGSRFGMFIHWGLYSLAARHEWLKTREKTTDERYDKYFKYWYPDLLDMRDWARRAREAGMKYAVLTAKHHEGFCLWDSTLTDYKSTKTRAARDHVREFVDAFRAEGLRVGFYYSLLDWHHPHFTIDLHHPRRDDADAFEQNKGRDMRLYAEYMRGQVAELLTHYGKIDLLWLDFSYPELSGEGEKSWMRGKGAEDWQAEELIRTARSLQPEILINNRSGIEQDIWTPEQYQPREWPLHEVTQQRVVWEACQTFSGSWGYFRDEATWKSPKMLIDMLINTVSLGGNLLMNVGPTARGELDYRACDALDAFARWMHGNSRAIYGCTASGFVPPEGCRYTQNGSRLYLHLLNYPFRDVSLAGLAGKVDYAQFLHDGSEILSNEEAPEWNDNFSGDFLNLRLPAVKPPVEVPVIELYLNE